MDELNNTFSFYGQYNHKQISPFENFQQDKNNLSAFNLDFSKLLENTAQNNNSNYSPDKKKHSLDMSYYTEQNFYENSSNINIEEDFQHEETCKIIIIINQ
jgi:hypothetical protein